MHFVDGVWEDFPTQPSFNAASSAELQIGGSETDRNFIISHNFKSSPDNKFLHWDGSWSEVATPGASWGSVNDIFVLDKSNAWATSGNLIAKWNGSAWSLDHTGGTDLTKIWARSATDVWVIGGSSELWHYDGSWTNKFGDLPRVIALEDIHGLAAGAHVWVVGQLGGSLAYIHEYDGVSWTEVLGGAGRRGRSIWSYSTDFYHIGRHTSGAGNDTTTQYWNGSTFVAPDLNLAAIGHTAGRLHGIAADDILINVDDGSDGETWRRNGSGTWSQATGNSNDPIILGKISSYLNTSIESIVQTADDKIVVTFTENLDTTGASGTALVDAATYSITPAAAGVAVTVSAAEVTNLDEITLTVSLATDAEDYDLLISSADAATISNSLNGDGGTYTADVAAFSVSKILPKTATTIELTFNRTAKKNVDLVNEVKYAISGSPAGLTITKVTQTAPDKVELETSEQVVDRLYQLSITA